MEALVIAVAIIVNMLSVYIKVKLGRKEGAAVDIAILLILASMFSGTISGMLVVTILSACFSSYTLIKPINLDID